MGSPAGIDGTLLQGVKRISGPASYHVYRLRGTHNTVYLFGDYHFSYDNMCSNCTQQTACQVITDIIDRAAAAASSNGTSLDVLMEFPYVVKQGAQRDSMLERVDDIFMRDAQGGLKDILTNIFGGKSPQYIGIFSLLYRRFAGRFYKHRGTTLTNARFHYSDARYEPNVKSFLTPVSQKWVASFHRCVPTVQTFRHMLETFVLGHYKSRFQDEMRQIFGDSMPVFQDALSSKRPGEAKWLHKISKQVYKLGSVSTVLQSRLESFINEKLNTICDILKNDLRYEDGVRLLQTQPGPGMGKQGSGGVYDGTLAYIRASRLTNYIGIFAIFMTLVVQTAMMDVYLLARMLYYACKPSAKRGVTIVYAGDYHISVYADFLRRYLSLSPLGCHVPHFSADMSDEQVQAMVQRCISVNLGTCNVASVQQPGVGRDDKLIDDAGGEQVEQVDVKEEREDKPDTRNSKKSQVRMNFRRDFDSIAVDRVLPVRRHKAGPPPSQRLHPRPQSSSQL